MPDDTLQMIARLRDDLSPQLQGMIRQIKAVGETARGSSGTSWIKQLREQSGELGKEMKEVLDPALKEFGITVLSVSGGLAALGFNAEKVSKSTIEMKLLADQTRLTFEDVERLKVAGEHVGIPADQMASFERRMAMIVAAFRGGPGGANARQWDEFVEMLGKMGDKTAALAQELDRYLALNPGNTGGFIKQLLEGIDQLQPDSKAYLLGRLQLAPEYARLNKELERLGPLFKDDTKAAQEFINSQHAVEQALDNLQKYLTATFRPTMTEWNKLTAEEINTFWISGPKAYVEIYMKHWMDAIGAWWARFKGWMGGAAPTVGPSWSGAPVPYLQGTFPGQPGAPAWQPPGGGAAAPMQPSGVPARQQPGGPAWRPPPSVPARQPSAPVGPGAAAPVTRAAPLARESLEGTPGVPAPGGIPTTVFAPSGAPSRSGGAPSQRGGTPSQPGVISSDLAVGAARAAQESGAEGVQKFLAKYGVHKDSNWCGDFAAAVVRSVGGEPPKGYPIASNWRNWGTPVDTPSPGDVAIRKSSRFGGYTRTGEAGSHVTIVGDVDPNTGKFTGIGGNQGKFIRDDFNIKQFEFRRGSAPLNPDAVGPVQPGAQGLVGADDAAGIHPDAMHHLENLPATGFASERYHNPGAQWPTERAIRYGMTGYGVIGGANKIANFPSDVHGLAANMDLLSQKYVGMTVGAAAEKWSGGGRGAVPGYNSAQIITPEMASDPNFMLPFMRSHIQGEGRRRQLTDDEYQQAFEMYKAGGIQDRKRLDKSINATTDSDVKGTGELNVSVNAPRGTKAKVEADGMFEKTKLDRTITKDEPESKKGNGG
jgi:uncharacterized protein (TIGR02594 family)